MNGAAKTETTMTKAQNTLAALEARGTASTEAEKALPGAYAARNRRCRARKIKAARFAVLVEAADAAEAALADAKANAAAADAALAAHDAKNDTPWFLVAMVGDDAARAELAEAAATAARIVDFAQEAFDAADAKVRAF